jgi:hypothetical protein
LPNRAIFNFHYAPNLVKFGIVRQTPNIKWPVDVGSGRATFWKMVAGAKVTFGSTIVASSAPGLRSESVGSVADVDFDDEIDALEMDMDCGGTAPKLAAVPALSVPAVLCRRAFVR